MVRCAKRYTISAKRRGGRCLLEEWDELENGSLTPRDVSYTAAKCAFTGAAPRATSGKPALPGEPAARRVARTVPDACPSPARTTSQRSIPSWPRSGTERRNAPVTPDMVLPGSHRRAWWRCEQGHSWSVSIKSRTCGSGCPVCANRKIVTGENDLATACPELALEWDEEKNAPLTPHDVFPGSGRRVWWRCDKGHTWRTRISFAL